MNYFTRITDWVKNRNVHQVNLKLLESLFNNAQDAVMLMDLEGAVLRINPAWEALYGWMDDEVVGSTNPVLSIEEFCTLKEKLLKQQCLEPFEMTFRRRDGAQFYALCSFYTVDDADRNIVALVLSTRDITDSKEAALQIQASEEKYRLISENSMDLISIISLEGTVTYASPSFERILGVPALEYQGATYLDFVFATDAPSVVEIYECVKRDKTPSQIVFNYVHMQGEPVIVDADFIPIVTPDGGLDAVLCVAKDIRQRIKTQQALQENEERYSLIAKNSSDLVRLVDSSGKISFASPSHKSVLDIEWQNFLGRSYLHDVHPEDMLLVKDRFESIFVTREAFLCEYRRRHSDGTYLWMESHTTPVFDDRKNVVGAVWTSRDITDKKTYRERLEFLAFHDPLTHLPNRRLFSEWTDRALQEAKRVGHSGAVLFLDCDQFKRINDDYGHDVGDEVIQEFGRRITAAVREGDLVSRLGGDEFVVFLIDVGSKDEVAEIANRILRTVRVPWTLQTYELSITSSIGVSMYPQDGQDVEMLLKRSDEALYMAKESGRDTYRFYQNWETASGLKG